MRVLALVIAVCFASGPSPGAPSDSVPALLKTIDSPSASESERAKAVAALRSVAAQDQQDPRTKEATFALADYLSRKQGDSNAESVQAMAAATLLYPDDARTPGILRRLVRAQLAVGDRQAAHLSFGTLMQSAATQPDPDLIALATVNAVAVGDMNAAFAWSARVDPARIAGASRTQLLLARVKSAHSIGRHDAAVAAAAALEQGARADLRLDPDALLAAARSEEALGKLGDAASHLLVFANIHPRHPERPEALLELGRVQARLGKAPLARRTYEWVESDHAGDPSASEARVEKLDLEAGKRDAAQVAAFVEAIQAAAARGDGAGAKSACDRLVSRFLGSGMPLEAVTVLARLAREKEGIAPLASRESLSEGLGPAIDLLASRGDDVSLLAAVAEAESVEVTVPADRTEVVDAARARFGLARVAPSDLDHAVEAALADARAGRFEDVRARMQDALAFATAKSPERSRVAASELLAEALWREGKAPDAIRTIDEALLASPSPEQGRPLRVLKADILFAGGQEEEACALYTAAFDGGRSTWVASQLERCGVTVPPEAPQ